MLQATPPKAEVYYISCEKCPKKFKKKDHFKNHFERIHLKKKKSCNFCKKMFHPLAINRHEKICSGIERQTFQCSLCNKNYSRKEHLKTHLITHQKNEQCEFIFEAMDESELYNELWCIEQAVEQENIVANTEPIVDANYQIMLTDTLKEI